MFLDPSFSLIEAPKAKGERQRERASFFVSLAKTEVAVNYPGLRLECEKTLLELRGRVDVYAPIIPN